MCWDLWSTSCLTCLFLLFAHRDGLNKQTHKNNASWWDNYKNEKINAGKVKSNRKDILPNNSFCLQAGFFFLHCSSAFPLHPIQPTTTKTNGKRNYTEWIRRGKMLQNRHSKIKIQCNTKAHTKQTGAGTFYRNTNRNGITMLCDGMTRA